MKHFRFIHTYIHTYIHHGRFRHLCSWLLAFALIAQSLAPLLAQDPGYLPPADPTDATVESWQPTPGVDPSLPVGEPALPFWESVLAADSLDELAPARFSSLSVSINGMEGEMAVFSPGAHQAAFDNGTVMFLAETPATAADLQVAVSPWLAVKSEPPYPDGSQFRLTLALTNTQTARAPERLERPFFLALDVRTLMPEPPKDANWFVALRLPDDSGWSYPEMTVHDPAGLLSVPLNRGDYGQVVVGLQTAAASDTPQPWRYQWQVPAVSTFSGAATYQFPIEVPPGRAGLTPNIDISYSSSGLNGLAYTTGMDQGLLGLGWQINQIQITRRTVGLGGIGLDDQRVYPKHGNHFDLVINGSSHHLAHYRTEGNTYLFYAENAPGLRVRQIYAPGSSGINRDAVYWTVQTPDGTTYRLGYDENSETGQETQYVTVHMSGAQAEGNLTDYSGLRWMVDTITDVNGNQIQYDYEENWLPDEWYGHVVSYTSRITTSRTRPIQIRYNFTEPAPNADTRVNATAASKIEFVYTDTRVSQIKLYHLEATPYRIVDLVLDAAYYQEHQTCFDAKPDYEAYTLTVTGIRILNGDGSEALPETRFTYTPLRHIPEGNWYPTCFQFAHLIGVDNGYGGQVSFVYAPDGRHADTVKGNPEYAMSFIVQEVQYWDGVHANPARTAYSYSAPCYDQADGDPGPWDGAANCPSRPGLTDFTYPHGPLVGFDTTTAVHLDYDGQPVRTEVSSFWRGAGVGDDIRQRQGRPIQFQVYDTANNLVQQQKTFYGRDNGASFDFTYANRVCTSPYLHGSGEHCVNYTYGRQNDVQYGNLTQIQEEGDIGGETNRQRLVYREYYPNPTTWVVNKVAREAVFAASAGTTITPAVSQPEAETRYYYDGNRTSWEVSPTKGLLVKVESLQESEAPPTPPTSTATPTAAPTSTPLPTVTPTPSPTATVPPPAAPTNLYAAMAGDAVSLRWEYYGKVTEAVTFNVYRSPDFPVLLPDNRIATGLTGWYFTDRKGKSSDYYVVTAVTSHGESLPSNTARADDGCINCFQTMSLENTPLNPYPSYIVTQRLTYTPNFGLVQTVTDANNHVTSTTYDGTYLYPVSVTNAANQTTSYAYYGLNYTFTPVLTHTNSYAGLLAQVTDPSGFSTHYTYDPFGRLERVFRGWEEQGSNFNLPSAFYRYYDYGPYRLHTKPWMIFTWNKTQDNAILASNGGTWERQFYDGFGNLIQTQRPHMDWGGSGIGQEIVTDMRYDSRGQLLEQSAPNLAAAYVKGFETVGGEQLLRNPYKTPVASYGTITSQYSATGDLVRQVGLDDAVNSAIYGLRSLYQQDGNNNLHASFFDATGQLAAVDEMLAGFSDNFDHNNPALPGWAKSGSVVVSSGRVHITGAGNYATYLSRPMATAANGDAGAAFTFRLNQQNALGQLYLDKGSFNDPASYRRWALRAEDGSLTLQQYGATINNTRLITNTALMPFQANTDYRALLRRSGSDADFALLVWQADNPANRAEVRLPQDASWKDGDWRFAIQVYTNGAVMEFDDYAEADIYRTRYRYDINGNLTQVNDALGNETRMTYDGLGRKRFMHDPDMGDWYYTYDAAGNLTSQTDANLQTLAFTYDSLNRLLTKGLGGASGSLLAAYSYDESSNGIGRRTSMIAYDPPDVVHNSAAWTYDSLGRVTQESRTIGSQSYTFQYGYTQGDVPVSIRYPGGAAGQLGETVYTNYWWQTGQPKNSIGLIQDEYFSYITQATYDFPHGQMDQLVYGNNQQTDYTYDAAFRLKTVTHSEGYQNLEYEYDAAGNVTRILDRFNRDSFNNPFNRHFYYDSLNRLVRATGDHVLTFDFDESYAYDPIGNIVNKAGDCLGYGEVTGSGECGGAPATGPQPHAVTYLNGDQKFWYDVNGNMTRRIDEQNQDWTLTWTPENMLHNATDGTSSVTFVYDADGMMVQRTENGQTTNYLGKLFEHNVTLGSFTKHYQFGGRLAAVRTGLSSSSPVSFLLTDHLGSTTATVFAGTGGLQSLRQYTAWGEEYSSYNVTPTGYRYTSQRWDSGLGLYDYNARYYDPHIGKFISADTLVPDPAAPQAFNRYAYTLSNPLRYSDPTGHLSEDEIYDYFGFSKKQDARDLNWAEDLIKWLWDDDVTWGDVFTYDAGEAMLVLFEAVQQDSELYRGGFWGLNGSNRGQEVYTYEITFVDDHTETAVHLEYHYGNNWDKLPRQTGLDGYNNYDPTIYRNYWTETAGVGVISFLGGLALLVAAPPTGIAAWVGAGTTAFGATYSGYQLLASQFSDDFPVMRIPRLIGNAPVTHHLGRPTGLPGQ